MQRQTKQFDPIHIASRVCPNPLHHILIEAPQDDKRTNKLLSTALYQVRLILKPSQLVLILS